MDALETIVYGERFGDLLPTLEQMRDSMRVRPDGLMSFSCRLPPQQAAPFERALLRAEAELMLEDAEAIGSPSHEPRTREQRSADALLRMMRTLPWVQGWDGAGGASGSSKPSSSA
jgi:hypothetical protein